MEKCSVALFRSAVPGRKGEQ